MVNIYAPWAKGLCFDKESLKLLSQSSSLNGVETSNYDEVDAFHESGIFISIHNPLRFVNLDLLSSNLAQFFQSVEGKKMIADVLKSDSEFVSFHVGHNLFMFVYCQLQGRHYPEPEVPDEPIEVIVENLNLLTEIFKPKKILFEALDSFDFRKHFNKVFNDRIDENLQQIDSTIPTKSLDPYSDQLIKAAEDLLEFTSTHEFIKTILERTDERIGFLFDVAHLACATEGKISRGKVKDFDDYMIKLIAASKGRTHQLHLNVPSVKDGIMLDGHNNFSDNALSKRCLMIASHVLHENPNLRHITLEIRFKNMQEVIDQARLVRENLNI